MKKLHSLEEYGRGKAEERYGSVGHKSQYGHSKMGQNLRSKYEMARGGNVSSTSDDDTVKTTTRFLPRYDFDYDPTGGRTTQKLIFQQDQPEVTEPKKRMDRPLRQEDTPVGVYPRSDRPYRHGGKVKRK